MCGICGVLTERPGEPGEGEVRATRSMLERMVHRGPDADGLYIADGVVAGIRRLAVVDLEGGDQPIANEDGRVRVVFNGEIYNHRELRRELTARGHTFRTHADTEVLVHLWEEYGPAMLDRLNGMFAFCLRDDREDVTFLARDRFGIKPLFYHRADGRIVFASEVGVLLRHPGVPRDVDPETLVELYNLQFVGGDRTIYRGIRKLMPGHAMTVRGDSVEVVRWYEPRTGDPLSDRVAAAEELTELLRDAVSLRLKADVPVGVFLSGGLDSSTIAALAAPLAEGRLETFSVGFREERFDERAYAARVSEAVGAEHHALEVDALEAARRLPELVEHLEEPVTDPAIIPTYLLSKFARERVTVALSGEGADELFGGYRRYDLQRRYGRVGGWLSRVPGFVAVARAGGAALKRRGAQAVEAVTDPDPARAHVRWCSLVPRSVSAGLFGEAAHDRFLETVAERIRPWYVDRTPLAASLLADQHEWLGHNLLHKVDRASMAHSLEARVPFLDHRVVEWAARLPDAFRLESGVGKRVLRDAAAGRVPEAVLTRPKQGFELPLAEWIRGPLRELAETALAPRAAKAGGAVDGAFAASLLAEHVSGRRDHGLPLFNLISIELFLGRA